MVQVANLLNEETPQIYTACGRGPRSSLRVLRPGLALTELAVWPLPGAPTAVWTLKRSQQDELDALIVVSFDNATLVCQRSADYWAEGVGSADYWVEGTGSRPERMPQSSHLSIASEYECGAHWS